jgi:hypothetical protein
MANCNEAGRCDCGCKTCDSNRGTIFLLRHCGNHNSGCHNSCKR